MGLFSDRKIHSSSGQTQVPVWFMRQAGRYHSHYQRIKEKSDFMTMCKDPQLAAAITMGPIEDFDFDAAILFSDLLFPLEQLGMGLTYQAGPPQLAWHIKTLEDLKQLKTLTPSSQFYRFQGEALQLLRRQLLPKEKTLLGFTGAPFTLYAYAVEGSHAGNLVSSKMGLYDGRFAGFMEHLLPLLKENLKIQAEGGADALCLFDTAAGELSLSDYKRFVVPHLRNLCKDFKGRFPDKKLVYYSKFTHLPYLHALEEESIDVLGVDWRMDLAQALKELGKDYYIQGNMDPVWNFLPWPQLEQNLRDFFSPLQKQSLPLDRWIFGLGHGVLVGTPEENVRRTVKFVHDHFIY